MATIVSDPLGAGSASGSPGDREALLADGLRAGRRDAFEQLYELYRARIYNLALRIVQSPEDACDITQDVFIKAFRKLPDSVVNGSRLTPWLYRVAVNASYDHLRSRRRHGDLDDDHAASRAAPVDRFEQAEMGSRVEQTLGGLSERHRAVLVLKDIHGLRHDEIAQILGTSRGATETLLFRAREAFRARYLELAQGQPGSRTTEKWSAAGIGIGLFLHDAPLPAALQGGFPFMAAAASGASAGGAAAGATAAGAAAGAGAASGSSAGLSVAAGGLLAKVGGAATAKLTAVVVAATCATGGGVVAYESGALPGTPHHTTAGTVAQVEHTKGKVTRDHGGVANPASLTGAVRSGAARERAADRKSGRGEAGKARVDAPGKADKARPDKVKVKVKAIAAGENKPDDRRAGGNGLGDIGGNPGNSGHIDRPARSDKPDNPDKPDNAH
jgi:RNA polymerase sigma-70 factor (ECF subfamily)